MKNITIRVEDDFHYSVKMYATEKGETLQEFLIKTVTKELEKNNALKKAPEKK